MSELPPITVDTSQADAALRQLDQHAKMSAATVIETARKGVSSLLIMGQLMNVAIPAWFNTMYGAVFMLAQTWRQVAIAEIVGGVVGNPYALVRAGMAFMASTMLFAQSFALLSAKQEASRQTALMVALLNTWAI